MRRLRWLPVGAAMAVVALSAPAAGAQDKQPTATGTGGAAASVDPLATKAAIDVLAARRQRVRRGDRRRERARRRRALQLRHRRRRVHGDPRRRARGKITTLDSRETSPAAMVPDTFFINGKPPTDAQFPINRYSGLSAGVPGTPARGTYVLHHYGTYSLERRARLRRQRRAQGLHRRQDVLRPDDAQRAVLRRRPVDRRDLPRRRRHAARRRHDDHATRTWPRPTSCSAATATERAFYRGPIADAIVKAARQPRRSPRPPTTRGGRACCTKQRPASATRSSRATRSQLNYRGNDIYGMAPAVLRRHDRPRGAEHHAGLAAARPTDKHRDALPLPRGLAAGLRRPQRVPRRPGVRDQPDRGPARPELRRPARRADRPDRRPPARSPPARRPAPRRRQRGVAWTRSARPRT